MKPSILCLEVIQVAGSSRKTSAATSVSDSSDDEKTPEKQTRVDRAMVKVDNFEGTEKIQGELQRRQHEFQAAQAEKHREWVERRDYERNIYDQRLQRQAEEHQSRMARNSRDHLQQLAQVNMKLMYQLFNSGK